MVTNNKEREPTHIARPGRRRFLVGACLALGAPGLAASHGIGIVRPPLALPAAVQVVRSDGTRLPLGRLLTGQITALQLMFTGCSETCPLQGALFASVQNRLVQAGMRVQLLSLSIDPTDDAQSLAGWLQRFGASKHWRAAVPGARDIDLLRDALQAGSPTKRAHTSQVYFVDQHARLIWRSEDFPPVEVVVAIARELLQRIG